MRQAPLILAAFALSACITTQDTTEYDRRAPEIMAYVSRETGKPPAPIPEPSFKSTGKWGALYDAKTNTIILGPDWQPDLEGLRDLAHEFTHAVQHHAQPHLVAQHVEWAEQAKRGKTAHLIDFSSASVRTCIRWETEAYQVDIAYGRTLDPVAIRNELRSLSSNEAAAIWAQSSCKEVMTWRDKVHGIERGYGKTYHLERR